LAQEIDGSAPGAAFSEGHVEADGFHIRYMVAGEGQPLLHLHGAGGLRLTPGHDVLSRQFQIIAFEMPGFGASPENTRTRSQADLSSTMAAAAAGLGLDRYAVMGTSFGGRTSLYLAAQNPQRVSALVLEAPAAIRPAGVRPPSGGPVEMARLIYGHPERLPPLPAPDPAIRAKNARLVERLRGPDRDTELEALLPGLTTPTLVLFGTLDRLMPSELGRHYKALLPNCHLVLVYDAGHAISTERPEAFAEIVADFVERRETFVISRSATVIHP
jgi:pimeloyl-ACP methyl ester carboxylesterase